MSASASAASMLRDELARPLLAAYAAVPGVEAVALSGSTARAAADRWSDIEVMAFWSHSPSDEERADAAASGGATPLRFFAYYPDEQVWCDDLSLGPHGILVEVTHLLVSTAEEQLRGMLSAFDPDPLLLNFAQGLVDAVPAAGSALIDGWKSRVAAYPDGLQAAVIERTALIEHFWRWRMLVERENPMLLASAWGDLADQLYRTVLALNKLYGPGRKSPDALSRRFEIAPVDFAARLRRSFALSPAEQAAELASLVAETYDLIEKNVPAVNVAWLREIFEHARVPV